MLAARRMMVNTVDSTIDKYGISSNRAVKILSGSAAVWISVPGQANDVQVDTSGLANAGQYITVYAFGSSGSGGYLGAQVHAGTIYVVADVPGIGIATGSAYTFPGGSFPGTIRVTYDTTTMVCTAYLNGTARATLTFTSAQQAAYTGPFGVGISNDDTSGAVWFDNYTANGTIVDSFDRPDASQLGKADSGQDWQDSIV